MRPSGDLARLRLPWREIDEPRTAESVGLVEDAIENIMLDMVDNPEWLHRLVKFMSDGILRVHDQAEDVGDWNLSAH